jgi:hypothetical protein
MNIEVQYRDNNIEAIVSNEYKLLVVSMDGLSLLTNLVDFEAPAKFLKIDKERKKRFIDKCLFKLYKQLCKNR